MIMKKMYKQPIVETTGLIAGGQALCSSPQQQGIESGGNTSTSGDVMYTE